MEKFKNFFNKIRKAEKFARNNVTPLNSTIAEFTEYKEQKKVLEEYEKNFENNKAA